jgi:hypothetical protein
VEDEAVLMLWRYPLSDDLAELGANLSHQSVAVNNDARDNKERLVFWIRDSGFINIGNAH